MATTSSGLRERKKRRTREQLEDVALALFEARGFDQVTVDEIAAQAEVSRSTFFRYFPTKEDVLVARAARRLDELQEAFLARPADEPVLRALRHAVQPLAAAYEDRRGEFDALRHIATAHPAVGARALEHQSAWQEAFADQLLARMSPSDDARLQARVVAGAFMAAIRVAVDEWLDGGGDLRRLLDTTFDVLDEGLGATLERR